jgi:hypothetical protein
MPKRATYAVSRKHVISMKLHTRLENGPIVSDYSLLRVSSLVFLFDVTSECLEMVDRIVTI